MRILLSRHGRAWGDHLIVTPLIKYLKEQGNEIYFFGGEAAEVLAKRNPYIDKFIMYKENTVVMDKLDDLLKETAKAYECDKIIDMSQSLENALLRHPNQPEYNDTKAERIATCDKNVYDYAFVHAGYPDIKGKRPELYPDPVEEANMKKQIQDIRGKDGFVVLWGLAGSGSNKAYPYYFPVWNDLICKYKNVKIVSVGDEACRILEVAMKKHPRYFPKSGIWKMTESMIATKYVDLLVSPDTGLFHASGCFDTKKLCILGHGTINHISKYFKNDYSIEADLEKAPCSPCFHLVYSNWQCPCDEETGAPICISLGQPRERLTNKICSIIDEVYDKKM